MRGPLPRLLGHLGRIREARAIHFLALLSGIFLALSLLTHTPYLTRVDTAITHTIQARRSALLDQVAEGLTALANGKVLLLLGVCGVAFFLRLRRPWAALHCAAALLGLPINLLLKQIVGRPRPDEGIVAVLLPVVGLSFPSGHAMTAVMFYGFWALMAWIHLPRQSARRWGTLGFAALALGISLSRIYVGAHWFSDVVGGWTAGLFFLLILAETYKLVGSGELGPRA